MWRISRFMAYTAAASLFGFAFGARHLAAQGTCYKTSIACGQTVTATTGGSSCRDESTGLVYDGYNFSGVDNQKLLVTVSTTENVAAAAGLAAGQSAQFLGKEYVPSGVAIAQDASAQFSATVTSTGPWSIAAAALAINLAPTSVPATYTLSVSCSGINGCTTGAEELCLANGRFKVTATFADTEGQSGSAQTVALTDDTGYLWFFASSNVESVVKVIDGCALNGHYWVFAGGLTNVKVQLTVTDMKTSKSVTYTNPQNTEFQPIQDTSAFATCP
jgi:hypothetical protein